MHGDDRRRAQVVVRLGGLAFVVAWLFSQRLQGLVPFWLPFFVLAVTEIEFVARAWWDERTGRRGETTASALERRLPGAADSDLGWIEVEDDEGEVVLMPAPPRALRPRRRLRTLAGLAVAGALFVAALDVDARDTWASLSAADKKRGEARFSREASVIAGQAVRIACDEQYVFTGVASDAAGVAFPRQSLAYLAPSICRALFRIAFQKSPGSRESASWAIVVLAHEAVHLRGVREEGVTECYALQEGVTLGRRLGLPDADARELMEAQLARALADRSIDRAAYRLPAGCRDGGSLDLRAGDRSFP